MFVSFLATSQTGIKKSMKMETRKITFRAVNEHPFAKSNASQQQGSLGVSKKNERMMRKCHVKYQIDDVGNIACIGRVNDDDH
jgi:hypothetical protein